MNSNPYAAAIQATLSWALPVLVRDRNRFLAAKPHYAPAAALHTGYNRLVAQAFSVRAQLEDVVPLVALDAPELALQGPWSGADVARTQRDLLGVLYTLETLSRAVRPLLERAFDGSAGNGATYPESVQQNAMRFLAMLDALGSVVHDLWRDASAPTPLLHRTEKAASSTGAPEHSPRPPTTRSRKQEPRRPRRGASRSRRS